MKMFRNVVMIVLMLRSHNPLHFAIIQGEI